MKTLKIRLIKFLPRITSFFKDFLKYYDNRVPAEPFSFRICCSVHSTNIDPREHDSRINYTRYSSVEFDPW